MHSFFTLIKIFNKIWVFFFFLYSIHCVSVDISAKLQSLPSLCPSTLNFHHLPYSNRMDDVLWSQSPEPLGGFGQWES